MVFVATRTAIDYVVAATGLVILAPLLLVVVLLVRLDSPGPVFFRRVVVGRGESRFRLIKFRTMYANADEILARNDKLRQEYERNFKLYNDPRVTRIGRFLRRSSLDEVPQLINVLAGQMSLVGPRTVGPEELFKYGVWKRDLLTIKPGLTGLWQVSGRGDVPYDERVKIDIQYVRNRCLALDLWIILRTIPAVLSGRGAY
jgi:lipopolysaccharide/colanic/teichoic acid biosynthesis glycosyltransferase